MRATSYTSGITASPELVIRHDALAREAEAVNKAFRGEKEDFVGEGAVARQQQTSAVEREPSLYVEEDLRDDLSDWSDGNMVYDQP